jgi:hypothetical protein
MPPLEVFEQIKRVIGKWLVLNLNVKLSY